MVTLLPFIEQSNVNKLYSFNKDWSDPSNVAALNENFPVMRCPSTPGDSLVTYPTNSGSFISPQNSNAAFAPPAPGSTTLNILARWLHATTKCTPVGWVGDYAGIGQIKSVKNASGAEIGYANPLVTITWAGGGSKGATRQNDLTPIRDITDGTSNTTLYSERCGKGKQYFRGVSAATAIQTGAIWADSDNRITVTGTSTDGTTAFGSGPCIMNCNNQQGDIYSFHTGDANVAFADGHVQFISESIPINIVASLVTKGGDEVVDGP